MAHSLCGVIRTTRAEISRLQQVVPLTYVIGPTWEGGNVSHYAPTHPRLLIDADPTRTPSINLEDLKAKGAAVVWGKSERVLPEDYKAVADNAQV